MKQALSRILPRTRMLVARVLVLAGAACAGQAAIAQADPYAEVGQLVRTGKLAEASTKVEQYLAGKPRDPQMRFLKSVVQTEQGKPDEAVETLTQITQEFPELPEPYNNLAVLYAGQNQYDKARTALEMAIRLNPNYATAHENLGDVYAKLASQSYGRSLQLQANNPQATQKVAALATMLAPQAAKPRAPSK
ncbi:tetratricopeptide repeat protein [Pseudorhodoferax soli]|uniref:Tetratricopeptide repeat protein n=1 Tax=Pseudorhodoferax soli TaxID=545864 RepID=A0A368XDP4_9BURK|nr:tetratricopeptide repeat protein [Pseudorhodoferax soli]RCW64144.1 tetratricopeptide repeat protein [Pseudorhodoferax soli]